MASQNCLTDKQTRLLMLEAIKYNNIAKVGAEIKLNTKCFWKSFVRNTSIIVQMKQCRLFGELHVHFTFVLLHLCVRLYDIRSS